MTTSSAVVSGVTMASGDALALVGAVVTISGTTFSVVRVVRDAREVARGEARRVVEALAALVHMDDGALAQLAKAGHWAALLAVPTLLVLLEQAWVGDLKAALAPAGWVAPEVTLVACLEEVPFTVEVLEADSRTALLGLGQARTA